MKVCKQSQEVIVNSFCYQLVTAAAVKNESSKDTILARTLSLKCCFRLSLWSPDGSKDLSQHIPVAADDLQLVLAVLCYRSAAAC